MVDETVPVRELFYGTILSSGADAALGLATYVAGSQEAFVALMNEKLEELGIADTAHFTNCVGLYDEAHKCTVSDMAVILEAAMDNDLCREVLGARTYETLPLRTTRRGRSSPIGSCGGSRTRIPAALRSPAPRPAMWWSPATAPPAAAKHRTADAISV